MRKKIPVETVTLAYKSKLLGFYLFNCGIWVLQQQTTYTYTHFCVNHLYFKINRSVYNNALATTYNTMMPNPPLKKNHLCCKLNRSVIHTYTLATFCSTPNAWNFTDNLCAPDSWPGEHKRHCCLRLTINKGSIKKNILKYYGTKEKICQTERKHPYRENIPRVKFVRRRK